MSRARFEGHIAAAEAFLDAGNTAAARHEWRSAAEIDPHHSDTYYIGVRVLRADGAVREALDLNNEWIARHPRDPTAHLERMTSVDRVRGADAVAFKLHMESLSEARDQSLEAFADDPHTQADLHLLHDKFYHKPHAVLARIEALRRDGYRGRLSLTQLERAALEAGGRLEELNALLETGFERGELDLYRLNMAIETFFQSGRVVEAWRLTRAAQSLDPARPWLYRDMRATMALCMTPFFLPAYAIAYNYIRFVRRRASGAKLWAFLLLAGWTVLFFRVAAKLVILGFGLPRETFGKLFWAMMTPNLVLAVYVVYFMGSVGLWIGRARTLRLRDF